MKIAILIYPHCSLWSASGPYELLMRANKAQKYYYNNSHPAKPFEVKFVASKNEQVHSCYDYPIHTDTNIYSKEIYDLIIVPGFDHNPGQVLIDSKNAIYWMKNQHKEGAIIGSICTGSFLVAQSGVLNNKNGTTHWILADLFQNLFPEVRYCHDRILIDNGDTLVSGAATSFQNLILYIIEKQMGRKISVGVSKLYLIDFNKDNQQSYSTLTPQKSHKDHIIQNIQQYIEDHYNSKTTIEELASIFSISSRQLLRRFKKATGNTPWQYIQKVKIEKAKEALETGSLTFEKIAYSVGYEDPGAFRKVFIKNTGITPGNYRKRYNLNYC